MRTLDLLPSLDTRTVIRHTLVKNENMGWIDDYASLDRRADPFLVEPKGYVFDIALIAYLFGKGYI